ncbi:MAG: PadR family transcriptional regulator [Bacteroidetes bacterium]|nr:PadR family transcriptional regulator [Bacteroidota bacterium]MCB9042371.1 PadR family transcriptional regulator [Chitinophagales bacterium]
MKEIDAQNKLNNAVAQMRRGVLELCTLAIIAREEMYPSDIIEEMKTANIIIVEGTLYPLLTRLKNEALLTYRWEESKSGPPRKYYSLTENGREYLAALQISWDELVHSVGNILQSFSNNGK